MPGDGRVATQLLGGLDGAGEGNRVLPAEVIEQITDATADQLQAARRQQPGAVHQPHQRLGDIGRRRRRLGDHRHAGEKGRREFFQKPPAGKVEGIDMHGNAVQRRQNMHADEIAALGQALNVALDDKRRVRQFAPAARGVGRHGDNAAVDIDGVVAPRRAGVAGKRVEFDLVFVQMRHQGAQDVGALVERQRAQSRAANAAGMRNHARNVEAGTPEPRHYAAINGTGDIDRGSFGSDPAIAGEAVQGDGHGVLRHARSRLSIIFVLRHTCL